MKLFFFTYRIIIVFEYHRLRYNHIGRSHCQCYKKINIKTTHNYNDKIQFIELYIIYDEYSRSD